MVKPTYVGPAEFDVRAAVQQASVLLLTVAEQPMLVASLGVRVACGAYR